MGHRSINHVFDHFAIIRRSFTAVKLGKLLTNPLESMKKILISLKHGQDKIL